MNYNSYKFNLQLIIVVLCIVINLSSTAQPIIHIESGGLFTGKNDIRNGITGTVFSLKNDFKTPVSPFFRLRVGIIVDEKNHFSVLYAPLKIKLNNTLDEDLFFDGINFNANIPIDVVYKFNSYRFTYNRRIIDKEKFTFGLGITFKIREAGVTLQNKDFQEGDFSTGFVPLINLIANWDITEKIGIDFFGDGLIASRGRAIDLSTSLRYQFNDKLQGHVGYRILDGGSDGTNRYNFIQVHFLFASIQYSFIKKRLINSLNF